MKDRVREKETRRQFGRPWHVSRRAVFGKTLGVHRESNPGPQQASTPRPLSHHHCLTTDRTRQFFCFYELSSFELIAKITQERNVENSLEWLPWKQPRNKWDKECKIRCESFRDDVASFRDGKKYLICFFAHSLNPPRAPTIALTHTSTPNLNILTHINALMHIYSLTNNSLSLHSLTFSQSIHVHPCVHLHICTTTLTLIFTSTHLHTHPFSLPHFLTYPHTQTFPHALQPKHTHTPTSRRHARTPKNLVKERERSPIQIFAEMKKI